MIARMMSGAALGHKNHFAGGGPAIAPQTPLGHQGVAARRIRAQFVASCD
jgi:hypothetical protein